MNNLKRMILVCAAVCLAFPAYAAKEEIDPWPGNFVYAIVYPDYTAGDYLCLAAVLRFEDESGNKWYLQGFEDVEGVKVEHEGTGWEADLVANKDCKGNKTCSYNIRILPDDWMYTGTWRFTLKYEDTSFSPAIKHRQIADYVMGEVAFPPPPFRIRIWSGTESYKVSWSGIGDPGEGRFKYCVRVFEKDWSGVADDGNANFYGVYDSDFNRVTVDVPVEWEGYPIRIENQFFSPRGPNDQQYNRAKTHGRLLPKHLDYD